MNLNVGRKETAKVFITVVLIAVMIACIYVTVLGASAVRYGIVNTDSDYLYMRAGAGRDNDVITSLPPKTTVKIIGEEKASDGVLWYKIEHEVNGSLHIGFVSSDFILLSSIDTTVPDATTGGETTVIGETTGGETTIPGETTGGETTIPGETGSGETTAPGETTSPETTSPETTAPETTVDFETYMNQQKFPEDYKESLRKLHEKYPNWVFKAHHTGYNFEFAVEQQYGEKSLVENTFPSSWKSTDSEAYDWETGKWIIFDGDRWVRASKEIIMHYMDPRNFLDEESIFQFLDQSYDEKVQNIDGVKRIIKGSFMEKLTTDSDGKELDYAQVIFDAGVEYKVNPYVLAAMILIEVGNEGSSIVSGTVPGYYGYYNFFNIGAYSANGMNPVQRGLWYAKGGSNGSTTYLRPWNTRVKAIRGGAYFYSYGYLTAGQTTLYLKRFNVQGDKPFMHQYMTSVYGPAVEGRKLAKGYSEELRETALSFYIPVFEKMPEKPCEKPTKDGSPNMKLSSLGIKDFELTPEFDADVLEYTLVVSYMVNSVEIEAVPMDSKAKIVGAGKHTVNAGNNVFEIKVTAENGDDRTYKITVAKESIENLGDLTFTDTYTPKDSIVFGIVPGMTVEQFAESFISVGKVSVINSLGAEKNAGDAVATGDKIIVKTTLDIKYGEYTASVKGDLNSDGAVTISDLLKIRNIILGNDNPEGAQLLSGDIDGGGSITISDLLRVRNHILGTAVIS